MPSDATPDPYADPLVFGQRLQILRTRRGLTREQLGGLAGRSRSWVKGVETGRLKTPKLEVVVFCLRLPETKARLPGRLALGRRTWVSVPSMRRVMFSAAA